MVSQEAMECPVCYTCDANCHLVCGHSFCKDCVKNWYFKSQGEECNCPMCRSPLYFRGMWRIGNKWDEERIEQQYTSVFNEAFEEIMEDVDPECEYSRWLAMTMLEDMQTKFNKLTSNIDDGYYDEEELLYLISNFTISIGAPKEKYDPADIPTYVKNLFVPKTEQSVYRPYRLGHDRSTDTPPMDLYTVLLVF